MDERYLDDEYDDYEEWLDNTRKHQENYAGWLTCFAPKEDYRMSFEKEKDLDNQKKFINYWKEGNLDSVSHASLIESLSQRKTSSLDEMGKTWSEYDILAFLLLVFGNGNRFKMYGNFKIPLRNYPSGGAQYPILPYLYFNKSIGRFKKNHGYLVHPDIGYITELKDKNCPFYRLFAIGNFNKKLQQQLSNVSFACLLGMNIEDSFSKYRSFAEQLAYIEAGHIGQNIQLVSTLLGKNSQPTGGVLNDIANYALSGDVKNEFVIYGIFLG